MTASAISMQQVSPATGTTTYHYDSAWQSHAKDPDARGVAAANFSYDALDRVSAVILSRQCCQKISPTPYDQSGHGFGAGRLTSVTDAAGTRRPVLP